MPPVDRKRRKKRAFRAKRQVAWRSRHEAKPLEVEEHLKGGLDDNVHAWVKLAKQRGAKL